MLSKYQDEDGQKCLLQLNQALDFTKIMTNSILCTNQDCRNGMLINDVPKIINHSLPQCIIFLENGINIPLLMRGPIPVFPVLRPSDDGLEILSRLQLTSDEIS